MMSLADLPVHARLLVKRTPSLYRPAKRLARRNAADYLCDRRTDLCIEGYPSSGNSFSFAVLRLANEELRIAHHCHSVANLQIAINYGVPAICLIRTPEDAITSRLARFGGGVHTAMLEYLDFYGFALKRENRLIIATFDEVTQQTGAFLDRLAATTGLEFQRDDIARLEKRAVGYIEKWSAAGPDIEKISLPSGSRERSKARLRETVRGNPRFRDAHHLWERLTRGLPASPAARRMTA